MQVIWSYLFYNVVLRPSELLLEEKKKICSSYTCLAFLSTEVYFMFLYYYFNSFYVMEEYHC